MSDACRDWLDGLIDRQGFTTNVCADPGCHKEHEVLEISDIEQTILAAPPQQEESKLEGLVREVKTLRGTKQADWNLFEKMLRDQIAAPPVPLSDTDLYDVLQTEFEEAWTFINSVEYDSTQGNWWRGYAAGIQKAQDLAARATAPEPPTPQTKEK